VGNSDPLEFIEAESNRVPFKLALARPHVWQDAFKNWPLPPIAGWRNWYKRILEDKSVKTRNWDSLRIGQCLELSLAETPKNESLLIAACHFWSNGVNAFLFRHGPMSPTLADVYMMTGLDVTGSMYPYKYKNSVRQRGVKTRSGYKQYIQNHMSDGSLIEVEYRAFLNMWLCRFIFCGKADEPTLNHIAMAEDLATGHRIPLGKYLLGSVYHMLHQTTHLMYTSQKISCVNGLWWFVQMWLQLYICTKLLVLISTIGTFLHPTIRKEKTRSQKDAKLMVKPPQPQLLTKTSVNSLSSSSEVSPIPFGFLICTMIT
jgi:hypothetical protein